MTVRRVPAIAGELLPYGAPAIDRDGAVFTATPPFMTGIVVRRGGNAGEHVEPGQIFDLQTDGGILAVLPEGQRWVTLHRGRISDA